MQTLKRFGLFWVDFIVGDDWTLAVVVVVGLLVMDLGAGSHQLPRLGWPCRRSS